MWLKFTRESLKLSGDGLRQQDRGFGSAVKLRLKEPT
jgi:hypothetical protein